MLLTRDSAQTQRYAQVKCQGLENKIDKPLTRLVKRNRESTHINRIRNEKGKITMDPTEIQRIIGEYYENLYANKLENLGEMDNFLEKYNLPRLTQKETENQNRPTTSNEIESVIKKYPRIKPLGQIDLPRNFIRYTEKK